MPRINTLTEDSVRKLANVVHRQELEIQTLHRRLAAFRSELATEHYKPFCRFTLNAALAVTDVSKAATIVTQYGDGLQHQSTSITVYNLLTHTAGSYVFEGDSGDAGIAAFDKASGNWYILQMECP